MQQVHSGGADVSEHAAIVREFGFTGTRSLGSGRQVPLSDRQLP